LCPQQEVGFISFSGGEPFIVGDPTPPPGVVGGGSNLHKENGRHLDINFALRVFMGICLF